MEKAVLDQCTYETLSNKKVPKIYVIMGKTASGKTSIARDLSNELGIDQVISYTTRPPREGEINGVHYHFTDNETFESEDFICKEQYVVKPHGLMNYGVNIADLETDDDVIIVLTPPGYRELKEKYRDKVVGIYIMAPGIARYNRYVERDPKNPALLKEAHRRFNSKSDNEYFYELEFESEYIVINKGKYETAFMDAMDCLVVDGL
jgi:guanylate kinase